MREHAEQAEARANAAYEQNRAALERISQSIKDVRNMFTKARRARERFHDAPLVSLQSHQRARRYPDIRAPLVQRAEGTVTDRSHGVADYQCHPRGPAIGTAAAQPSAVASQNRRPGMRSASSSHLAESKDASADLHAQGSTAQLTPREAPRGMNMRVMRVHEWVAN